ncbi:Panacea domain-containing protein [Azospirillum sp. B4]|uniref:Panacea domain-containing protein n=1 Tax=Azospirillum sp. B4 TaxID=95605 RepID=UPI0005CAC01C|nr:type II toxin-antitoxin system antitoxin SocA domain-containing protein [Azospirillum sp. B4]
MTDDTLSPGVPPLSPSTPTSDMPGMDCLAVCNMLLDLAGDEGLSPQDLQSLLYLAHGLHLRRTGGRPLVYGYFEAWEQGPVHPTLQSHLTGFQGLDLTVDLKLRFLRRRSLMDPMVHRPTPPESPMAIGCGILVVQMFRHLSPDQLHDLVTAPGSPWDTVLSSAVARGVCGFRIPDGVIRAKFHMHKLLIVSNT